jgi:hypothetical protein
MPCYVVLFFKPPGLQPSPSHVSYATVTVLTHTLCMLPKMCFGSNQKLFPLEAEVVSTRSRSCFYSKYDSLMAVPAWHLCVLEAEEPLYGFLKADESCAMDAHHLNLYQPGGSPILQSG